MKIEIVEAERGEETSSKRPREGTSGLELRVEHLELRGDITKLTDERDRLREALRMAFRAHVQRDCPWHGYCEAERCVCEAWAAAKPWVKDIEASDG